MLASAFPLQAWVIVTCRMKLAFPGKTIFMLLATAAVSLRVAFFCTSVTSLQPSADESVAVLQAQDISRGAVPLLFTAQPYLFPIESYIMAPFARLLPPNAFGARLIPFLLGLLTTLISLRLLQCTSGGKTCWTGALLILFPSSYYLTLQSAYALPGYTALPLLAALGLLAASNASGDGWKALASALLAGLISGLMFSSHMLALPVALMVAACVCLGSGWRKAVAGSACFATGAALGLTPYLVAKVLIPGAHVAVTATLPAAQALARLWSPAVTYALTAALGERTCVFPDNDSFVLTGLPDPFWGGIWGAIWGLVLLACIGLVAVQAVRRLARQKWPSLLVGETFAGIAALTLVAFLFSMRDDSHSYRYFLPLVWSAPFLLNYLHDHVPKPAKRVVLTFAILLALWNIAASDYLMHRWRDADFPAKTAGVADLQPALAFLQQQDIRHAVASYGAAYRINFMSGGTIIASQPVNERFPGWPIPYKDTVDRASDTAYVLTDTIRFLKPDVFERHLNTMGVQADKQQAGDFSVYYNFRENVPQPDTPIPTNMLTVTTSHNPNSAFKMNDRHLISKWTTECLQTDGMWVRVDLREPQILQKLRLHCGAYKQDQALEKEILALVDGDWQIVCPAAAYPFDKFIFENGHPVYGDATQTITFAPVKTTALMLRITKPSRKVSWTLLELQLFSQEM